MDMLDKAESEFQSTPSVGRATRERQLTRRKMSHFNPRPPWGGRQISDSEALKIITISIHALRGEGDG